MSEQWLGLHNPDRHTGEFLDPRVSDCPCCECSYCASDQPCRCCLAAEVEALRAQLDQRTAAFDGLWEHDQSVMDENRALNAKVQRVRELHAAKDCGCCCTHCDGGWPCPTIQTLDGAP